MHLGADGADLINKFLKVKIWFDIKYDDDKSKFSFPQIVQPKIKDISCKCIKAQVFR